MRTAVKAVWDILWVAAMCYYGIKLVHGLSTIGDALRQLGQ